VTLTIGIIGLGQAGQALAEALSARHSLILFDREPDPCARAVERCLRQPVAASSAADCAAAADLLLLSLPAPDASRAVARQIADAVRPGTLVVETSTVRPEDVEDLHAILSPGGAAVIDAAVIGGVHKLAAGKGVFLVGPSEQDAGAAAPVLRAIAEEIFFLNGRGDGMRAKLVANAVSHTAYVLLLEAGALAAAQGIPLDVFYRLMERESGLLRPLTHRFGERLRKGDFDGGMSTINARKDSGLVIETARSLGVPLFAIAATHGVYEIAVGEGLGDLDYASMGRLWEKWLGIDFADQPR
jgi:3-hydroxyisobutyrate dehydrogenase-like beta-hydroxyacid dehydrogenase